MLRFRLNIINFEVQLWECGIEQTSCKRFCGFERKAAVFGAERLEKRIEELLLGTLTQLWKKSDGLVSVLCGLSVQPW